MEKLLVNVSLFFSEVAFIQIFEFLAHPMDGSLMFFFQCLRRATFFSWRGCYLHGKMLYVCSQSSSHRISQESLTEKAIAFLLNVSLRFLQNNIHSDHWLTMQVFNFQMLETFLFWYKKVKKSLAHLLACMRKHPLQETLSGSPQTLGVFLKVQLQQTRSLWVGLAHPCAWSEQTAGELLCVAKHRTQDVDPHLFSAECCWHCQSSSVLPSR